METCAGCGAPITPTWKYCVHCGLEVERPEVPAAIRLDALTPHDHRRRNRALLFGGIGIFLVGIALMVVAGAFLIGTMH
jgi:predicted nucleic acid-binding Zn ribbon protein